MKFYKGFTSTVMNWIIIVNFSILINGTPTDKFTPTRGIRHGDPLSLYIFILCVYMLSKFISNTQKNKFLTGISITKQTPNITHFLFVDETLYFVMLKKEEAKALLHIINTYHCKFKFLTHKSLETRISGVRDLKDEENSCWNNQILNLLFPQVDKEAIKRIPLINPEDEGTISWMDNKYGNYNVKSGYHCITNWKKANNNDVLERIKDKALWKKME